MGIAALVSIKDYDDKIAACYQSPFKSCVCYKLLSVNPTAGDVFEIKLYIHRHNQRAPSPWLHLFLCVRQAKHQQQKHFASLLKRQRDSAVTSQPCQTASASAAQNFTGVVKKREGWCIIVPKWTGTIKDKHVLIFVTESMEAYWTIAWGLSVVIALCHGLHPRNRYMLHPFLVHWSLGLGQLAKQGGGSPWHLFRLVLQN